MNTITRRFLSLLLTLCLEDLGTALTLRLHLLLHGAAYRLGRCNILQLNTVYLYAPLVCCLIQDDA